MKKIKEKNRYTGHAHARWRQQQRTMQRRLQYDDREALEKRQSLNSWESQEIRSSPRLRRKTPATANNAKETAVR